MATRFLKKAYIHCWMFQGSLVVLSDDCGLCFLAK